MEELKHECGVAMIRLLKPLEYYERKYGTWAWGFNKLYLMMEKQHNRGQEGAGLATVSLTTAPGSEYMFREKAEGKDAITEIFARVNREMAGELYMGHLRYSTTGKSGLQYVHPFLRRNNWRAKNLCLCGNFNMTNIDEVFSFLTSQGQSPRIYSDSYITLELMGHRLDREVERRYAEAKAAGLEGLDITRYIDDHVEMANVLKSTMSHYDGGYVMCGLTGSGEMFCVRDPWGIRTAFWYQDDDPKKIVMVSSSPQIRYPDFYGIDMARLEELCAFRAAIALIREQGMTQLIADTYAKCKAEPLTANHVRAIYAPFTVEQINRKIVEMLRPEGMQAPIELVFQSIEGLHKACPNHSGDWYFTGHYPTPGGVRLVNQAFVNYVDREKS